MFLVPVHSLMTRHGHHRSRLRSRSGPHSSCLHHQNHRACHHQILVDVHHSLMTLAARHNQKIRHNPRSLRSSSYACHRRNHPSHSSCHTSSFSCTHHRQNPLSFRISSSCSHHRPSHLSFHTSSLSSCSRCHPSHHYLICVP